MEYVVFFDRDGNIQEVECVTSWAEYPFQPMIVVRIFLEIVPPLFVCRCIG